MWRNFLSGAELVGKLNQKKTKPREAESALKCNTPRNGCAL
jgi:hypothetical protein